MTSQDWQQWHERYADPASDLSARLRAVRGQIAGWLDRTAPAPVRVVSACAGDGRDLLGVLADRRDADRVTMRLVECDAELAGVARTAAAVLPGTVEVVTGDAARSDAYAGAVPADLVLLCGIFGNVSDTDVHTTVAAARSLCAPGAEVIWTRHRRDRDLTPAIRQWFGQEGFTEVAFVSPGDGQWSVGTHRLAEQPLALTPGEHWFDFVR